VGNIDIWSGSRYWDPCHRGVEMEWGNRSRHAGGYQEGGAATEGNLGTDPRPRAMPKLFGECTIEGTRTLPIPRKGRPRVFHNTTNPL